MTVIINAFEIVPEETPAPAPSSDQENTEQSESGTAPLTPADIAELTRHQAERETRLRAH